jgi:hypothetical protein
VSGRCGHVDGRTGRFIGAAVSWGVAVRPGTPLETRASIFFGSMTYSYVLNYTRNFMIIIIMLYRKKKQSSLKF